MIYDHVKENERQLERRTCKYGQEKQQTKGRKQFMLSEKRQIKTQATPELKNQNCVIVSQTVIFRTCSRGARGFIRGQVALDPIKRDIDHSAPLIKEEIEREIERRKEKKM